MSKPSHMYSVEMPYPSPISIVLVASSRITHSRKDSPSAGLAATGNSSCDEPSDLATTELPSLTKPSITALTRRRAASESDRIIWRPRCNHYGQCIDKCQWEALNLLGSAPEGGSLCLWADGPSRQKLGGRCRVT